MNTFIDVVLSLFYSFTYHTPVQAIVFGTSLVVLATLFLIWLAIEEACMPRGGFHISLLGKWYRITQFLGVASISYGIIWLPCLAILQHTETVTLAVLRTSALTASIGVLTLCFAEKGKRVGESIYGASL